MQSRRIMLLNHERKRFRFKAMLAPLRFRSALEISLLKVALQSHTSVPRMDVFRPKPSAPRCSCSWQRNCFAHRTPDRSMFVCCAVALGFQRIGELLAQKTAIGFQRGTLLQQAKDSEIGRA